MTTVTEALELLADALDTVGHTPVFNAISAAVEWRENRTIDISVQKFIAALRASGDTK